jgi:hypothetical protein
MIAMIMIVLISRVERQLFLADNLSYRLKNLG